MEKPSINLGIASMEQEPQKGEPFYQPGERKIPMLSGQGINTNAAACSRENGRRLDSLPNELLLQIMTIIPPVSLWSLRQTSVLFLRLFDTKAFSHLHKMPGFRDPHKQFSTSCLQNTEIYEAARFLRRDKLYLFPWLGQAHEPVDGVCIHCVRALEHGENHPELVRLRETHFCDGCKERHASIFFSPENRRNYDRGMVNQLVCIGRSGKMTLCLHDSHEPVTWHTIEQKLQKVRDIYQVVCTDTSHKTCVTRRRATRGMPFPEIVFRRSTDYKLEIVLGWDIPFLYLDPKGPPSTDLLRRTLGEMIGDGLHGYKPCKHMADGRLLRDFAYSSICSCFTKSDKSLNPNNISESDSCHCIRQKRLYCSDCGAVYAWQLTAGLITLTYRYLWDVWKPISPGWLSLLDEVRDGSAIFDEDNRHLLWCDSSGCATGSGWRWEHMVKEEIWLQHKRYGWDYATGLDNCRDLEVMRSRHRGSEKAYMIPPHVERSPLSTKAHDLMLTINQAASNNSMVKRADKRLTSL